MSRTGLIIDAFSYGEECIIWGDSLVKMWNLFSEVIPRGIQVLSLWCCAFLPTLTKCLYHFFET